MRRLISEIKADTGLGCSVGIGPNRLVAKVASDAEKPRGLRRAHPRAGVRALRGRRRRGCCPGSAPRRRSGSRRSGSRRSRSSPRRRRRRWPSASAAASAPTCAPARASRTTAPVTSERIAVSESRETTFPTDVADRAEQAPSCGGSRGELCEGLAKRERRGRTIAIKVRLDDFTTVTRARTIADADQRRRGRLRRRLRAAATSTRRRGRCGCSACAWRRSRRRPPEGDGEPQMTLAL